MRANKEEDNNREIEKLLKRDEHLLVSFNEKNILLRFKMKN